MTYFIKCDENQSKTNKYLIESNSLAIFFLLLLLVVTNHRLACNNHTNETNSFSFVQFSIAFISFVSFFSIWREAYFSFNVRSIETEWKSIYCALWPKPVNLKIPKIFHFIMFENIHKLFNELLQSKNIKQIAIFSIRFYKEPCINYNDVLLSIICVALWIQHLTIYFREKKDFTFPPNLSHFASKSENKLCRLPSWTKEKLQLWRKR